MKEFTEILKNFWTEEEGVTVVEYAVLVALIIIALLVAIGVLTGAISDLFRQAGTEISGGGTQ